MAIFLVLALLCPVFALAAEIKPDISKFELPKPEAPRYLIFEAADRTATEGDDALYVVRKADMSVLALSVEYEAGRDAFLDGTDSWNYTPEWDVEYSGPGAGEATGSSWIDEALMEKPAVFDLCECEPDGENYSKMSEAIIRRDAPCENASAGAGLASFGYAKACHPGGRHALVFCGKPKVWK